MGQLRRVWMRKKELHLPKQTVQLTHLLCGDILNLRQESYHSFPYFSISSVQLSRSVMSNSLWPHGLQHTRLPCPSPTPRAYLNSWPSHQWCHPTISSSVIPFSSHLQSFQHQGLFQWVGSLNQVAKSIGVSASTLVLPMNFYSSLLMLPLQIII